MKHTLYKTQGTCSQFIDVTVDDDGVVQQVFFMGGCDGNLQGICRLVTGQKIDDVFQKLNGIRCGGKKIASRTRKMDIGGYFLRVSNARQSWSGHDVGLSPQRMSSSLRMTSSIF